MKHLKFYGLTMVLCWLMLCLSGCLGMQIVSDDEAGNPVSFIAGTAAQIIKLKYADKIDKYINAADKVLLATSNDALEAAFNDWLDSLANGINDPEVKIIAQEILKSYDVKIDGIDFDWGARDKAKRIVTEFKRILEG